MVFILKKYKLSLKNTLDILVLFGYISYYIYIYVCVFSSGENVRKRKWEENKK